MPDHVLIGASLVDSIIKSSPQPNKNEIQPDNADCQNAVPSLFDSLLPQTDRLLIQGPSKSGLSSLLLELACSLASLTPCRCIELPCRCTAVWLLRPADKSSSSEEDCFPLHCRHLDPSIDTIRLPSAFSYPRSLLHRIQVHHISHPRDAYKSLLQVQGLARSKQPYGGILVDDIDRISGADTSPGGCPRLLQMVAVLADTTRFLERLKHNFDPLPTRLAVTLHPQALLQACHHTLKCLGFRNSSIWEIRPWLVSPAPCFASLGRLHGDDPAAVVQQFEIVPVNVAKTPSAMSSPLRGVAFPRPNSPGNTLTTPPRHGYYAILHPSGECECIVWSVER